MRKYVKLFLLAMTTLSLTACSSGNEGERKTTEANDNKKIVTLFGNDETTKKIYGYKEIYRSEMGEMIDVDYHEYDEDENEVKVSTYSVPNDYENYRMTFKEYDQNKLVKEELYYYGDLFYETEYEYDTKGNLVKKVLYSDGSANEWQEYEYNDNNQISKEWGYFSGGDLYSWSDYEYDSEGNLTEIRTEHNENYCPEPGGKDFRTVLETLEYDEKNQLIESTKYDPFGDITEKTEYRYDNDGNVTEKILHESGSEITGTVDFVYFYQEGELEADMEQLIPDTNEDNHDCYEGEDDCNAGNDSFDKVEISEEQVKKDVKRHVDDYYAEFGFKEIDTVVRDIEVTIPGQCTCATVQMNARSDVFALSLEYAVLYRYDSGWYCDEVMTTYYQAANDDNTNTILGIDRDYEQAQRDMIENEDEYDFYNIRYVDDNFWKNDPRIYAFYFTANYEDEQYGECTADVEVCYIFNRKTGQWQRTSNYVTGEHIPMSDNNFRFVMSKDDFGWW